MSTQRRGHRCDAAATQRDLAPVEQKGAVRCLLALGTRLTQLCWRSKQLPFSGSSKAPCITLADLCYRRNTQYSCSRVLAGNSAIPQSCFYVATAACHVDTLSRIPLYIRMLGSVQGTACSEPCTVVFATKHAHLEADADIQLARSSPLPANRLQQPQGCCITRQVPRLQITKRVFTLRFTKVAA